ncbi:MAG: LarC family nickel insertion protein, partial [Omnitrophica WOR_2 bacterium]
LGGLDTIVDVAGALAGLQFLEVEQVQVSALPLGRGFIQSAHGRLPLPAPATVALLHGAPVTGTDLEVELVAPTGAAILTSLAQSFGPIPAMTLKAVGYGAGRRDLPIPNVLRILLGEIAAPDAGIVETLSMLETNIDDLNPEVYEYVMAQLFDAGALDVFLSPIQMKKNRPAVLLRVLCKPGHADALSAVLFSETSTLGIRKQLVERQCLPRSIRSVDTPYGSVRVKIAEWGQGQRKMAPEYEDCKKIAALKKVPLWEVYQSAVLAARGILE